MQYSGAHQPIKVRSYSGQTYADHPETFELQGQAHKVKNIEKQWVEPGERHFLVRNDGNGLFELCYDEQRDEWSLIEFAPEQK